MPSAPSIASTQQSLIPQGREKDYTELRTPAVDFLQMVIDEQNMYVAPLIITNGSEDRDGEITNPDGLIDVAYRTNPLVFLQHSHQISPMIPPVGTSETPARSYDLVRRADAWYSGCRFSQSTPFGSQCFAMVADGLLRGRSIGALKHAMKPYTPKLQGVTLREGRIVPARQRSVENSLYELIEWSWVWVPSNRDIVTPMKSILSKGYLDGRPLHHDLKTIMKRFDLTEPESSAKHSSRPLFARERVRIDRQNVSSGDRLMKTPAFMLFDAETYSPLEAKTFLGKNADLGLAVTELNSVNIAGKWFLKSTQFGHDGEVNLIEDPRVPGLCAAFVKSAVMPEKKPPGVAEVIADQASGKVVVNDQPVAAQASQAAHEASETPAAEAAESVAVENPDTAKAAGPSGRRHLRALIGKATQLVEEAEAAASELEPEMLEKCGEFNKRIRDLVADVGQFETERYGQSEGPQKPEGGVISKALKAELFHNDKYLLPGSFVRGLQTVGKSVEDPKIQTVIELMLKGIAIPTNEPTPEELQREELRRRIAEAKKKQNISQVV